MLQLFLRYTKKLSTLKVHLLRLRFYLGFLEVTSIQFSGLLENCDTKRNNVNVYLKGPKRHQLLLPGVPLRRSSQYHIDIILNMIAFDANGLSTEFNITQSRNFVVQNIYVW